MRAGGGLNISARIACLGSFREKGVLAIWVVFSYFDLQRLKKSNTLGSTSGIMPP
jgi:hypothetical protein